MKTKEQFMKECTGCPALEEQVERTRVAEERWLKEVELRKAAEGRQPDQSHWLHVPDGPAGPPDPPPTTAGAYTQGDQIKAPPGEIQFSCPAGCKHKVLIDDPDHIASVLMAIEEQTGLRAWEETDGSIAWARHEPPVIVSVTGGGQVKSLAEYSEGITDPLKTAHDELDCAILRVDEEQAWDLKNNESRDIWISSVEAFMAAMLKWAQGMERRREEAREIVTSVCGRRLHDEAAAAIKALLEDEPPNHDKGD